jgi:hypothetical protein
MDEVVGYRSRGALVRASPPRDEMAFENDLSQLSERFQILPPQEQEVMLRDSARWPRPSGQTVGNSAGRRIRFLPSTALAISN